jgi:ATP-dependent Clp protease ATP-binding subunit ClpA
VDVQIRRVRQLVAHQDIGLELSDAAKDRLAEEGWDEEYGARPLKRVIQRRIQNPLADAILSGELTAGSTAAFDWVGDEFTLQVRRPESAPAESELVRS